MDPGPEKPGQKDLDPEKPGLRRSWTQKSLAPEQFGPWKTWTLKILDYEKRGKYLDVEKKIRRQHGKIY